MGEDGLVRRSRYAAALATATLMTALSGCSAQAGHSEPDAAPVTLPPAGAAIDYQLGEPYAPADEVEIVGRDRAADAAEGIYSICYINAFQTQPGELDDWPRELLLHADEGFDAVEFDNLDSYTRSGGALDLGDNSALAATLVDAAHGVGLAAGQKNAAEDAEALRERSGFDFALVEECAAYDECDAFTAVYGEHVFDIEYTDQLPRSFAEMCADASSPASMVLRDRDLAPAGQPGHVFETC